jgi:alpha-amylase/alpha-mannosidase (GH57 family)
MTRYVCIHGHFYQPPRENPWLEEVEQQDSARPYHDWNQRVDAECYTHNAASRIVDGDGRILNIVNNYSRISFNFGPTLLSWLERHDPDTYGRILDADRESLQFFSGHGSALAQAYNHMILPLASERDKRTQILWGIRDFEHRFGRRPEGMWLPETAVDLQSLDIMAEQGIAFTLLAPRQAHRIRRIGDGGWRDVSGGRIDPKHPYLCRLPSGRTITLFFYDGPISQGIAFEGLLKNGETLAGRFMNAFVESDPEDQLVHIATDGETYGHHHKWGEMALAYCLHHIESHDLARITVYGEYLEQHPPRREVEIFENSSWSCAHGVERWRADCGCCTGLNPGWNQAWRAPLRAAMDWLRDQLAGIYSSAAAEYVREPWLARDDYIEVLLDRTEDNLRDFLGRHQSRELSPEERHRLLSLLEMERHALLMYTSCGWFFDDLAGIEAIQVMRYAARAIQLGQEISGTDLETPYTRLLEQARSNAPPSRNGAELYAGQVKPVALDLLRVGAHYAISSLLRKYPERFHIYCYSAESSDYERLELGAQKLALGQVHIRSDITLEGADISFAVLHMGEHNFIGGGKLCQGDELRDRIHGQIRAAFLKGDGAGVATLIDQYYQNHDFGLWHLFRDEQRNVMQHILDQTLERIEPDFRKLYDNHLSLMLAMRNLQIPLPGVFLSTVQFILDKELAEVLEQEDYDPREVRRVIAEFRRWWGQIDTVQLSFLVGGKINALLERLEHSQGEETLALPARIEGLFDALNGLEVELDLWKAQNIYFYLINNHLLSAMKVRAGQGEVQAAAWVERFVRIGDRLRLRIT